MDIKLNFNSDGSIHKYKTWIVARSNMECEGVDSMESFAPVARFNTIRLVLSITTHYKWNVYQFDLKSTFLNGVLDEEVFMDQPVIYVIQGQKVKVYKLKKALYDLK